ncbi:LysR family transcriptional regulator [Roseateles sp. YR242]|uniref:LysR family transcriptional regulator n=1 Tax=Roseateles sp. YR242 TaxID=1855305 RepID=UPI000B864159|nr:LysR family transcriptional regulator [Roseateles sp. YR242]
MGGFSDLSFFVMLVRRGSLAGAAQELGLTPSAASKRLAALEQRLGVRLLHRTTRRISLTPEGETYLVEGTRVLEDLAALEESVAGRGAKPQGLLRVSATLGFGRAHVAPLLGSFSAQFPEVEVQLHLSDRPAHPVDEAFDVQVRIGALPDARLTARKLALNRRLLCASPAYLARSGTPRTPRELASHACLFLREGDEAFGTWHLSSPAGQQETVKVRGPLSTNDGACALAWALDGRGIVLRSQWDAAEPLRQGLLVPVLPGWSLPEADIWLVFPTRHHLSAKTRALVDFLVEAMSGRRQPADPLLGPW